jgi:2-phosphoglycerate kinase
MCRYVRKGTNFDIQKCFVDGKPLIIEGTHIDPSLYLIDSTDSDDGT